MGREGMDCRNLNVSQCCRSKCCRQRGAGDIKGGGGEQVRGADSLASTAAIHRSEAAADFTNRSRSDCAAFSEPFGGLASHAGSDVFPPRIPCPSPSRMAASRTAVVASPLAIIATRRAVSCSSPAAPTIAASRVIVARLGVLAARWNCAEQIRAQPCAELSAAVGIHRSASSFVKQPGEHPIVRRVGQIPRGECELEAHARRRIVEQPGDAIAQTLLFLVRRGREEWLDRAAVRFLARRDRDRRGRELHRAAASSLEAGQRPEQVHAAGLPGGFRQQFANPRRRRPSPALRPASRCAVMRRHGLALASSSAS